MSHVLKEVEDLIQGLQRIQPRLHQALLRLSKEVDSIDAELHPLTQVSSIEEATFSSTLAAPTNFTASSTGRTLRFTWAAAANTVQYEIRKGTNWTTATFVTRTTNLQADIDPILVGTHNYLIKSRSITAVYSANTASLEVIIPAIAAVQIEASVIDNNVLFKWNVPASTFDIFEYVFEREGTEVGRLRSTFTTYFESAPGVFVYSITPIDIAGNIGPEVSTQPVTVNPPPDYVLQNTFVSALGGTRVNAFLDAGPKLLVCVVDETYQEHFDDNLWASPQAQVDAGYPLFIQPAALTGSYEEIKDYGTILDNTIIAITYNATVVVAGVTVVIKMSVSDDGISYTPFVAGAVQFYANLRYLKFRLEFTGATDLALSWIDEVTVNLSIKREVDGGDVTADATDVGGTEVVFNKDFKDVESITLTVFSLTEPFIAIYDFTDIPNPTSFFVYVYDTSGNRVTKLVSWKARGIV